MEAFNLGSMLIQIVNLAVVLFVLKKALFDPYLKLVEKTEKDQAEINAMHETVEKIRKNAEKEATALISDAHKKAFEMREHAAKNAAKNTDDIVAQATEQGSIIIPLRWHESNEIWILRPDGSKEIKKWDYPSRGFYYEMKEVQECVEADQKESKLMPLDFSLRIPLPLPAYQSHS